MSGGMSNPWEYREIMKAAMRFNETRTVEEVMAVHEARRKEQEAKAERERKGAKGGRDMTKAGGGLAPVPAGAIDDLRKLLASTPLKALPAELPRLELESGTNG